MRLLLSWKVELKGCPSADAVHKQSKQSAFPVSNLGNCVSMWCVQWNNAYVSKNALEKLWIVNSTAEGVLKFLRISRPFCCNILKNSKGKCILLLGEGILCCGSTSHFFLWSICKLLGTRSELVMGNLIASLALCMSWNDQKSPIYFPYLSYFSIFLLSWITQRHKNRFINRTTTTRTEAS